MSITIAPTSSALKYHDAMPVVAARDQWNYTLVDLAPDAAQAIGGAGVPVELGEIYVDTAMSAHACPITDGADVTVFSLPASLAAGTAVTWCKGMRFETGLKINSNDAATGNLVVKWRAI